MEDPVGGHGPDAFGGSTPKPEQHALTADHAPGDVYGVTRYPSGLAMAGAKVVILNADVDVERSTVSAKDGSYAFKSLKPGHYQMSARIDGYASPGIMEVDVIPGKSISSDILLKSDRSASILRNSGSGYRTYNGAYRAEPASMRVADPQPTTDTSSEGTVRTAEATSAATATVSSGLSVTVSGTAQEGQTLTATPSGAVTGYQWQSFIGGTWTNISGATSSTYVVQEADEGNQLRVHVTSSGGSADSAATSAVIDISPTLTTPVISGTAQQGQTLSATAAVANDSDATVSYQWQANHGSGFVNIAGATSLSYVVQEADESGTLRIVATPTDTDGSGTSATSTATSAVIDISPTLTTPVISGT